MADVLSQAEIDALLSALTSGEVNAEEIRDAGDSNHVRTYDFRRAMRFSKDHIRIIRRIHEHFARLLATSLSGQLRAVVQIQVESVDQVPYEEFIRSIPTLTVIQVMELHPLQGKAVMEMNPQVVFALLDRLLGGVVKGPYRERELTEIEHALLLRALGSTTDFLAEAWRNVGELSPELLSIESNPQFLQLTTPNETVLVVTMSAKIGSASGLINLCIPHVTIEPLIPKLSTQYFMDSGKVRRSSDRPEVPRLQRHLLGSSAEVSVVLGEAELTLQELLDIQVGDVIPLNTPIGSPLNVLVNDVPTLLGSIGTRRNKYAVQILGDVKEVSGDDRGHEAVTG
ncbi:flagellar motor switch protein FliM [Alicyclobacillus contaminans]|uniref:flagellar motor switch protein FliM n=1 Tax=Alicyclobacillus contaminans TaxID=392016 RepID=UPI00041AE702|nr:flagellar motor switch protein FliM [Alicyclobacillus contaminans]GMA49029.1 flagellar motor switch protein FliM [Alicyclobacillus contaminans]